MTQTDQHRAGLTAGFAAYTVWGLMPLFWALLKAATPLEILSQRIVWSSAAVALVLLALRTPWHWVATVFDRRNLPRLLLASAFIAVNWLTYIAAVNTGHVVEASLGYFINPLVNVLIGALWFGEALGRLGKLGGLLALGGVVVIAAGSWATLWISLVLAVSFGLYGVAKKRAHLPALQGLLVESGFLAPLALGYLVFLGVSGTAAFGRTASDSLLLALTGPATALPLWLFAIAATRLPLGVLGVLQYWAPTISFVLGITLFGEHVTPAYWAGLVLVWGGSALYLASALSHRAAR